MADNPRRSVISDNRVGPDTNWNSDCCNSNVSSGGDFGVLMTVQHMEKPLAGRVALVAGATRGQDEGSLCSWARLERRFTSPVEQRDPSDRK